MDNESRNTRRKSKSYKIASAVQKRRCQCLSTSFSAAWVNAIDHVLRRMQRPDECNSKSYSLCRVTSK